MNHLLDTAWAGGLFEGEGCITTGFHYSLRMTLGMTDQDVVKRFAEVVGVGHVSGPKRGSGTSTPDHWKSIYLWELSTISDIEQVLIDFWPYLGDRRRETATRLLAEYRSRKRDPLKGKWKTKYNQSQLAMF